jgi:hypothetical protein
VDNLQRSDTVIAKILQVLVDRGLQPGVVDFSAIIDDDELRPRVETCYRWLEEEGLVRAEFDASSKDGFAMGSPSLTSLGRRLMDAPFTTHGKQETFADVAREVSDGHMSYAKAGNFSGGFLAAFIKSFG